MKNKFYDSVFIPIAIIIIVIALGCMVCLTSCSTVNRHKSTSTLNQSATVHVDSSTVSSHTKDTGGVKKDYSVVTHSRTDSSVTEQVIEFDTSYHTPANDYFYIDTTSRLIFGDGKPLGRMDIVGNIRKITTRTTTVIHQSGTTQNNKSDSNYLHIKDTVATVAHRDSASASEATASTTDVHREPWWKGLLSLWWLWLLIAFAIWIVIIWWKKNKNKIEKTLKENV